MLARVMPYAAIQFAAYEEIRSLFKQWPLLTVPGPPPRAPAVQPQPASAASAREPCGGSVDLSPGARALAGSLAGVISVLSTYPLDLARARLATLQGPPRAGQPGLLQMLRQTAAEGWRANFKGLNATLIGIVPYAGANFYAYGGMKELYRRHYGADSQPGVVAKLGMGATAGLIAQTICYPLDVVRRRQQARPGPSERLV